MGEPGASRSSAVLELEKQTTLSAAVVASLQPAQVWL